MSCGSQAPDRVGSTGLTRLCVGSNQSTKEPHNRDRRKNGTRASGDGNGLGWKRVEMGLGDGVGGKGGEPSKG